MDDIIRAAHAHVNVVEMSRAMSELAQRTRATREREARLRTLKTLGTKALQEIHPIFKDLELKDWEETPSSLEAVRLTVGNLYIEYAGNDTLWTYRGDNFAPKHIHNWEELANEIYKANPPPFPKEQSIDDDPRKKSY